MKNYLILTALFFGLSFLAFVFQRRYSSETLADGFMDYEKGKEVAPTVFKDLDEDE